MPTFGFSSALALQGGYSPALDLVPSDGSRYDRFGSSVALDEDWVLVGAPHHLVPQGTAYLYELGG